MQKVSENPEVAARMGFLAQLHVNKKFSRKAFGAQLDRHFKDLKKGQAKHRGTGESNMVTSFCAFVLLIMTAILFSIGILRPS